MSPRTLLLLLLPLLALGAWWALTRSPGADDIAAPEERSASTTGEGPVLEAATHAGTTKREPRPPSARFPSAGDVSTTHVRVYGKVILPEGVAAGAGVVTLLAPNESPSPVLARHALSDGLAFDWSVPFGTEVTSWELRAVLFVPGLPIHGEGFQVFAGGEHELTLQLPLLNGDFLRIEGRVTDHRGQPLEGLRLALTSSPRRGMSGERLPEDLDALLRLSSAEPCIVVTTAADGRFEARTHMSASYWPVSLDPKWVVEMASGYAIVPAQKPVLLKASPAVRVRGHVRDAATGKPLADHQPTVYVYLGERLAGVHGLGTSGADFDWATAVTTWGTRPVELEVKIRARLYEPFVARLRIGPDGLDEVLDVAMRPLMPFEIGELVVLSGLRDGQGRPLHVSLMELEEREGGSSGWGLAPDRPEAGDEGPVYRMAAGRHLLSAKLEGGLGMLLRWKGEVTVAGGNRAPWQVPWPPHGSLRVRYRPRAEGEDRIEFNLRHTVSGENVGHSPVSSARETYVPALPVGTWVLTEEGPNGPVKHTLEVVAGTETVLELDP